MSMIETEEDERAGDALMDTLENIANIFGLGPVVSYYRKKGSKQHGSFVEPSDVTAAINSLILEAKAKGNAIYQRLLQQIENSKLLRTSAATRNVIAKYTRELQDKANRISKAIDTAVAAEDAAKQEQNNINFMSDSQRTTNAARQARDRAENYAKQAANIYNQITEDRI